MLLTGRTLTTVAKKSEYEIRSLLLQPIASLAEASVGLRCGTRSAPPLAFPSLLFFLPICFPFLHSTGALGQSTHPASFHRCRQEDRGRKEDVALVSGLLHLPPLALRRTVTKAASNDYMKVQLAKIKAEQEKSGKKTEHKVSSLGQ